jgi:hypothetical protein
MKPEQEMESKPHLQAVLVVDVTKGQFVQSHDCRSWISVFWSIKYDGGLLDWLFVLEEQFYRGYSFDIKKNHKNFNLLFWYPQFCLEQLTAFHNLSLFPSPNISIISTVLTKKNMRNFIVKICQNQSHNFYVLVLFSRKGQLEGISCHLKHYFPHSAQILKLSDSSVPHCV